MKVGPIVMLAAAITGGACIATGCANNYEINKKILQNNGTLSLNDWEKLNGNFKLCNNGFEYWQQQADKLVAEEAAKQIYDLGVQDAKSGKILTAEQVKAKMSEIFDQTLRVLKENAKKAKDLKFTTR